MTDGPILDPLAGSSWSQASTVAGFAGGNPNQTLMSFARVELARARGSDSGAGLPPSPRALDIGCGAGRNAAPIAALGWRVVGTDLSLPMLAAAAERAKRQSVDQVCDVVLAPMERLPVSTASCDLVIAHGIWNLARSGAQFRAAVGEAARVARPGAGLFVFTFSRNTFEADAEPVAGEPFVFTQFSGEPQCFMTRAQLIEELGAAGFMPDPAVQLHELNRRVPGMLFASGPPVIWEGTFRRR